MFHAGGVSVTGFVRGVLALLLVACILPGAARAVAPLERLDSNGLQQTIVNSDGSILGVGTVKRINGPRFQSPYAPALLKLRSDGSIDEGFGSDGMATFDDRELGSPVELMPGEQGGTVLATDRGLLRVDADGRLDSTFGNMGTAMPLDLGASVDAAAVQSDGKILIAGGSTGTGIFVARYTSAGALDGDFGSDGILRFDPPHPGGLYDVAAIGTDGMGRIVVAGGAAPAAMRLLPNGQLDTSFGPGGDGFTETTTAPGTFEGVRDMVVDPNGAIRLYGVVGRFTYLYDNIGYSFGEDGMSQGEPKLFGGGGSGIFAEVPGGLASSQVPGRGEIPRFNLIKSNADGSPSVGFAPYNPSLTPGTTATSAITYSPADDTLIATGNAEGFDCRNECSDKTYVVATKVDAQTGVPVAGFGVNGAVLIPQNECTDGAVTQGSPSPWMRCRVKSPLISSKFRFRHGTSRRPALSGVITLDGAQAKPELLERHLKIMLPGKARLRQGAGSKLRITVEGVDADDWKATLNGPKLQIDIVPDGEPYDSMYGPAAPTNGPISVKVELKRGALAKVPRKFRRTQLHFRVRASYTPSRESYEPSGPAINWFAEGSSSIVTKARPVKPKSR